MLLLIMAERKKYYEESANYRMISADIRQEDWLDLIASSRSAVVVMEGVSMYLKKRRIAVFHA